MTHTPGPWIVEATRQGKTYEVYFGTIESPEHGSGWATLSGWNQPANAQLIAAAPDLLAALSGLLICVEPRGSAEPLDAYETRAAMLDGQIAKARAAYARATK